MIDFDDKITSRLFGYDSVHDYYHKSCCNHKLVDIKVPTFFINALDDPVVGEFFEIKQIKDNENILLGTTRHGGHLGYNESLFDLN